MCCVVDVTEGVCNCCGTLSKQSRAYSGGRRFIPIVVGWIAVSRLCRSVGELY